MTAEQLIAEIQILITRGTINPSAEISIYHDYEFEFDDCEFEFDEIKIDGIRSTYNKLILFAE